MLLNSLLAIVTGFYNSERYLWNRTFKRALLVAIINNLVVMATEIEAELCIAISSLNRLKRLCSKDYSPLPQNIPSIITHAECGLRNPHS